MKIKCLIIDDEPLAIRLLEDYISKTYFLEFRFSTVNPLIGLQKMKEESYDLVFLDIQMPELNGMDFLKIIKNKTPIILTTAYSDFALESYEYGVVDYLLKPISYDRFYKSVLRVKDRFLENSSEKSNIEENDFFFVKSEGKKIKVNFQEILYIEGLRDYVNIKTTAEEFIILENLKNLENLLPKYFKRIHKSYIVNLQKITSIDGNKVFIEKIPINIGETYKVSFQNWFKNQ